MPSVSTGEAITGSSYSQFAQQQINAAREYADNFTQWFYNQPLWKRVALQICAVLGGVVGILVLIFHKKLIHGLVALSESWHELTFGAPLLFMLIFFVGFPPLLGFSALSMLAGMIYGFPNGWFLLATASVSGSYCLFVVFRYVLNNQAQRLVNSNEKFRALAEILRERESSLYLLVLIRLCPLPYSLSNGALALVPELPAMTFLWASVLTSPKLLIHIFVGSKLKELGDELKSSHTKVVDIISIVLTASAAMITTYVIYAKMQKKLESYHRPENPDDNMVYGNFDDVNDVELNFTDVDPDNFVIDDDEPTKTKPNSR